MNTFRLLTPMTVIAVMAVMAVASPAFADQINSCKDASGRTTMTDRPCGDPSMKRFQSRRAEQIAVDQIQARDMFSARTKVQKDGQPISPEALEGDGAVQAQGSRGLF